VLIKLIKNLNIFLKM